MYQNLKAEIKEIVEIVKQCPESLQEKCFELLLENFLKSNETLQTGSKETGGEVLKKDLVADNDAQKPTGDSSTADDKNEEICKKDFHVKIQKFLDSNGISMEVINELYYKENQKLMPLYDTLKSTSMSECQIRLALLTAFENAQLTGEMTFNCEVIRSRCQAMKCYNAKNFAAYFKGSSDLWDNWPEKYDGSLDINVSSDGKKKLAEIMLDLAKGE